MRGRVSCHRVARSTNILSVDASAETQSTWVGAPSEAIICMLSNSDVSRLPTSAFYHTWALFLIFYTDTAVRATKCKAIRPSVREL